MLICNILLILSTTIYGQVQFPATPKRIGGGSDQRRGGSRQVDDVVAAVAEMETLSHSLDDQKALIDAK